MMPTQPQSRNRRDVEFGCRRKSGDVRTLATVASRHLQSPRRHEFRGVILVSRPDCLSALGSNAAAECG